MPFRAQRARVLAPLHKKVVPAFIQPPALAKAIFGTLLTVSDATNLPIESSAGMGLAMLEPQWRTWNTTDGGWDSSIDSSVAAQVTAYRNAGMGVSLSLGLHFPPRDGSPSGGSWMTPSLSHYTDQTGVLSQAVDFTWSAYVRTKAAAHIAHMASVIGFANIRAIRITSGCASELLYPQAQTGAPATYAYYGNSSWALNGGANLASGVTACPFPSYVMGNSDTSSLTGSQLTNLGNWYVDSLSGGAKWIMDTCVANGFRGWFEIVQPGNGVSPAAFASAVAAGFPAGNLLGVGAHQQRLISTLAATVHGPRCYLHCSSVADGSGSDLVPQSSDLTLDPTTSPSGLSSYRWQNLLAATYLNGRISGENPGLGLGAAANHYNDNSYSGLYPTAMRMVVAAANLTPNPTIAPTQFYAAHDTTLHDGTDYSFGNYAALVANVRQGNTAPVATLPPIPKVDVVATATGSSVTASSKLSWSHTVTSGATQLLVAIARGVDVTSSVTASVNTVTYAGVAMSRVGVSVASTSSGTVSQNRAVDLFQLSYPTPGTATIVVTPTVGGASSIPIAATSVSILNGIGVCGTPVSATTPSAMTTLAATVAADAAPALALAFTSVRSTTVPTVSTGTSIASQTAGSGANVAQRVVSYAPGITQTFTWNTADSGATMAFAIQ